jgi:hypothetical protein
LDFEIQVRWDWEERGDMIQLRSEEGGGGVISGGGVRKGELRYR